MKRLRLSNKVRTAFQGRSRGLTLVELVIAVALIGIIAVAFLGGLSNAIMSLVVADVRTTAESLARSEMEHVKSLPYASSYTTAITQDYLDAGYLSVIHVDPIEDSLQKITVIVTHHGKEVLTLENYKAER